MNNLHFEGVNTIYGVAFEFAPKQTSNWADGTMAAGVTEARANSPIIMRCIVVILIASRRTLGQANSRIVPMQVNRGTN